VAITTIATPRGSRGSMPSRVLRLSPQAEYAQRASQLETRA
jgi:hypothetical protein